MTQYEKEIYIILNGGKKIKNLPKDVFIFNDKDVTLFLHLSFDEAYDVSSIIPDRYLKFGKTLYLEVSLPNTIERFRSENPEYVLYKFDKDDYHKCYLKVNEAFDYVVYNILPSRYDAI